MYDATEVIFSTNNGPSGIYEFQRMYENRDQFRNGLLMDLTES